ncbi:NAD(P)H-binding protein [Stackebrandtia nassauensis]|nr:NAD(P)H-binding protein [Stackebrandtia nassauensis]
MADNTILVIGSTGKIGRHVAERLRERDVTVKAASRSGPVHFDWHDEATWPGALDGAQGAYLVDSQDADRVPLLRRFSALAAHRGLRRLVFLSAREAESVNPTLEEKEAAIKDAGTEWTILRPVWFNQNFSEVAAFREPLRAGELRLPAGDGPQPFIDAEDIAEVAAAALTTDGHHGRTYDLSGPEAISFGEAVAHIAKATGRDLRYRPVSAEDYVADPAAFGAQPGQAEGYALLMAAIAEGKTSHLSDGVKQALGRDPRGFAEYAVKTAATGVWDA